MTIASDSFPSKPGSRHASSQGQSKTSARRHLRDGAAPGSPAAEELERTWSDKPGIIGFLCANGHKTVGLRFIVTALCFFGAAGVMGGLMRHQLATPNSDSSAPTSTTSSSPCTARR